MAPEGLPEPKVEVCDDCAINSLRIVVHSKKPMTKELAVALHEMAHAAVRRVWYDGRREA